jgi:hypothetical protein
MAQIARITATAGTTLAGTQDICAFAATVHVPNKPIACEPQDQTTGITQAGWSCPALF